MRATGRIERKYYKYVYADTPELLNPDGLVSSVKGGGGWTIYEKPNYGEVYLMLNKTANSSYPRWQTGSPNVYAYIKTPIKGIISSYLTTQWCDDNSTGRICNHWIIKGYKTEEDLLNLTNGTVIDDNTWSSASQGSSKTVNLSSNTYSSQYYSIQMVSNFTGSSYCSMGTTKFYMKGESSIESTPSDYDYYKDLTIYRLPKIDGKYYGINQ